MKLAIMDNRMTELFEGLSMQEFDMFELWDKLADIAVKEAKFKKKPADDGFLDYGGFSEPLHNYLNAWSEVLSEIMRKNITRENVEKWMAYFDNPSKFIEDIMHFMDSGI